jgi:hypothetical protein
VAAGLAVDSSGNALVVGSLYGTGSFGSATLTSAGSYDAFLAKLDASGTVTWADDFGGPSTDQAKAVAVDSTGNVFVTGQFQSTAQFGTASLTSGGNFDAFVVKVSPGGVVSWAKGYGSTGVDVGSALAVGSSGAVTVGGAFSNTVDFDPGATDSTLVSNGGTDAFVLRLDGTGKFVWVYGYGGAGNDTASGVAVGSQAQVAVTGGYAGPAVFGTTVLPNLGANDIFMTQFIGGKLLPGPFALGLGAAQMTSQATAVDAAGDTYIAGSFTGPAGFDPKSAQTVAGFGGTDAFVAKYDLTGALLWVKDLGGTGNDQANALVLDGSGNAYVAGYYQGSATFGTVSLTGTAGATDAFVAKLDPSGNVVWANSGGGAGSNVASAVAVDGSGNVYSAGRFVGTAPFGTASLTSAGGTTYANAFVVKYSSSGAVLWAKGLGGSLTTVAAGLAVDSSGNALVVGSLYGTGSFGSATLTSAGGYDAFLAKLDASGTVTWADDFGGPSTDQAKAVAVDSTGNVFVTGQFQSTATFGSVSLTSGGNFDAFVAKVSPSGVVSWAKDVGGTGVDTGSALAVDSTGAVTVGGAFSNSVNFDPGATNTTLVSNGGTDAFLLKLDGSGKFVGVTSFGSAGNDTVSGMALPSDGSGDVTITGGYAGSMVIGARALSASGAANIFAARVRKPF